MKKLILVVFSLLLITCGCDSMMNTPTKRVEEFLNKYQRLDSDVLTQLDEVIKNATYTFNDTQSTSYKELMKKQYKDLTYTIKEELIDGNNATVTVEIEVYDYNKAINDAETYYKNNPNEFKNSDGGIEEEKYMDYKIKKMEAVKDKIKYTLNLTLTKKDKKWVLNDISESDRQKLHGLYNS